jgi:hypothetical protein
MSSPRAGARTSFACAVTVLALALAGCPGQRAPAASGAPATTATHGADRDPVLGADAGAGAPPPADRYPRVDGEHGDDHAWFDPCDPAAGD